MARAGARGAGETRGKARSTTRKKAKPAPRGLSRAAEQRATLELKAADPKLREVIESVGELRDWRERRPDPGDHYGALVRTITGQQLSTKAARAIYGRLTARFGEYSGLWSHFHTGLDFAAPSGTPIPAVANGVVTSTGYDGAYGNKTVITLDDGTELWFCHQTSYVVSPGDQVRAGQLIGYVGSTGNVTGPHVHIEVRPGGGDPVDPHSAMIAHGLKP